jgi:hypothetical protein
MNGSPLPDTVSSLYRLRFDLRREDGVDEEDARGGREVESKCCVLYIHEKDAKNVGLIECYNIF